jgi:EAL domain-containing protein (putative c-di-GMP-specific phosphodiesterase class I)
VQLQEEAEKRKLLEETEQKRKQQEEELRRKTEEAAEREKLRQQEELKRKQEEQLRHEEASRKKAEEDRRQKEEQLRKEAEARLKADEEKQRIAEQERLRQEEEKRKASEVERQRQEEIKRKAAEAAEQERQRQEEEKRKAAEAAEQEKQQQEEEAARQKADKTISDEITIDESTLDENSLILKKAFNENRVIQTFQPVIAMFTPEAGDAPAMFKVDIEMVDERGNIKASIDIDRQHTALTLQQFTDRWILREIIGRIANSDEFRIGKIYLITISEAWLADITLFTWLKKLLTGIENIKPGSSIALELPVNMLVAHKKRALALIKALKQSHGFEIAIGEVNTVEELRSLSGLKDFDLLTVKWKMIDELRKNTEANSDMAIISALKSQGVHIIFDGIEDATMMTEAISLGSDYVMGNFIGGPQSSLAGAGNVETFDISY